MIEGKRLARVRASAQLLARPVKVRDPVDVVRLAGPVQAQEPRAARLAFRARSRTLTAADVDRARVEERSLLRTWAMRKTAHLIATEDAGWLLPLFADSIVRWSRKRLADFGLDRADQDRALALLEAEVEREGALTRPQLSERLERAGFETAPQFRVHLWLLATVEGDLCLGPDRGAHTCIVRREDWIGEPERRPREDALAELARRFLRAYGPASERDLARWAGLPLRDCRLACELIAAELDQVRAGDEVLLSLRRERSRLARSPVVRLLGAYDNYNLGYVSRDFAVPGEREKQLVPGGGIVRPAVTVDGRVVGTWTSKRNGERLGVRIEPFGEVDGVIASALEAEAGDIGRFEGCDARLS